jgi:hypothetical protein
VQYVGNNYGQEIINELKNKITVDIIEPVHSAELLRKHGLREAIIRYGQRNIQRARHAQEIILEAAVLANDPDASKETFCSAMKSQWNSTTLRRRNSVTNGAPFRNAMPI